MNSRLRFYTVVGIATIFIFSLTLNQRYCLENYLHPKLSNFMKGSDNEHDVTFMEIQEVLESQRRIIEGEMENYAYQSGRNGIDASKLEDLVMERGGRPVRSVILTSWRSGSTFFGEILNAHPANFYYYEPLSEFGMVQVRNPPMSDVALGNIESMFRCDYSNLDRYWKYVKSHHRSFLYNKHLWRQCQAHKSICSSPKFVSLFCQLFPFQSMKLTRLRLRLAEQFLAQKDLGVRIVLLIRDPRGILQSRKRLEWCLSEQDCSDPGLLCSDMISDYNAAVKFVKKYPKTFKIVRYEDLSVDPYEYAKRLYKFHGLHFHGNVERFLDTHTKADVGNSSTTFRNSKATPFHWQNDLNFEEVEEIQKQCGIVMQRWGYVSAVNASHQKVFNPITDYSLDHL